MNKVFRFGSALLLVGFVAVSSAQVSKQGAGYLFRMKFTKGQTIRYQINSTVSGQGMPNNQPMKMLIPSTLKVTDVKNGVATVSTTSGPMQMNGQPMGQAQSTTIKMNSRGEVVGSTQNNLNNLVTAYPAGPVKVGSTWKNTINMPGMGGNQKVTATYKFIGLKNVGGKPAAQLNVTFTGQTSGNGTMMLSAADGSLLSSNMKMKIVVPGQNGKNMTLNATATISRK